MRRQWRPSQSSGTQSREHRGLLAHDVAQFVTGDTIYIDGGYHVVD
jgi:enoyl-[acyl-carrier-protein] reductase (NADH)